MVFRYWISGNARQRFLREEKQTRQAIGLLSLERLLPKESFQALAQGGGTPEGPSSLPD